MRRRHTLLAAMMAALFSSGCVTGSYAAGPYDDDEFEYEGEYLDDEEVYADEEVASVEAEPRQGDEAERQAALNGYGDWVASAQYGQVWRPIGISVGWRPYTRGRWMHRRAGWTWASDFPWGWVAFHYGRWVLDPQFGWVWIPGRTWGPAWVAWTYTDAYVGWAPLPPGVALGGAWIGTVPDPWWCFTRRRYFGRRRFRPRIVRAQSNPTLVRRARPRARPVAGSVTSGRGRPTARTPVVTNRRGPQRSSPAPAPATTGRGRRPTGADRRRAVPQQSGVWKTVRGFDKDRAAPRRSGSQAGSGGRGRQLKGSSQGRKATSSGNRGGNRIYKKSTPKQRSSPPPVKQAPPRRAKSSSSSSGSNRTVRSKSSSSGSKRSYSNDKPARRSSPRGRGRSSSGSRDRRNIRRR